MFPNIINTWVFSTIAHFLNGFWQDTTGKIFILTILAYSSSYTLYSGYISRFAGGYGGLLLSHFGFTVLDFLSLIPTVIILLIESATSIVVYILKQTFFHVILPFAAFFIVVYSFNKFEISTLSSKFQLIGALIWIIPLVITTVNLGGKINTKTKAILITIGILGMVVLGSSTPHQSLFNKTNSLSLFSTDTSFFAKSTNEGLAAILVMYIIAMPSLIGLNLATTAINSRTLSKIERIVIKQPLDFPNSAPKLIDSNLIENNPHKKHWLLSKEIPVQFGLEAFSYSWSDNEYPLLIASFSRTTALYFQSRKPHEKNKMILVSNDLIYSLELQSNNELED